MLLAEIGGVQPAVGQVRALGSAGPAAGALDRLARVGDLLGQTGAHGCQCLVQALERAHAHKCVARLSAYGVALEVPAHVLAQIPHAPVLAHLRSQQLSMLLNDGDHIVQIGAGACRRPVERRHDVREEPRPPLAAAAHHDAVAASGANHPQRVIPGPDVPIAEHRQGCRLLETGDRLPIRLARIMLTSRSAVQGDGRDAGILRRARDVHEGLMILVDADAGFNRHRHGVLAVRRPRGLVAGAHSLAQDRRQQILLPRQRRASAFARDLGRRTAEVEVDVVGQVLFDQDVHRRTRDRRVDPVELDGAHPLTGI